MIDRVQWMRTASGSVLLAVALLLLPSLGAARSTPSPLAEIASADLPPEGRAVLEQIAHGGPFRYERDGVVFGNRERVLPEKPRGYYHEYTVHTPRAKTRGARRIVCGGERTHPDACFYSDDHYRTFKRIRQ